MRDGHFRLLRVKGLLGAYTAFVAKTGSNLVVWSDSLHQSVSILGGNNASLRAFLGSEGLVESEVLARLPYSAARNRGLGTGLPDAKRYRDGRQVYQSIGLLYEDNSGVVHVTELGVATLRWLDELRPENAAVLGRHAAYALAVCQLRNPFASARVYDPSIEVFPFLFIWKAMLSLGGKISSEELNCEIFRVTNSDTLAAAIARIVAHRTSPATNPLGVPVVTGNRPNDRIVVWMALASFGWTLIAQKVGDYYHVRPQCRSVLREVSQSQRKHQDFADANTYIRAISDAASLPVDVRVMA